MPARPLYAITDDVLRLNDLLEELEGDVARAAGELEPAVAAWFEALAAEQAVKLDSLIGLMRQLDMEAAAAKAEAEQWAAKARSRERRADYLEARLLAHLQATDQTAVTTASNRLVTVQANGGAVPLILDDVSAEDVPVEYVRVAYAIDKPTVRKALEAGAVLAFARLGDRGFHLRVR